MRILIFGGSGMLGRALQGEALRRQWQYAAPSHAFVPTNDRLAVQAEIEIAKPDAMINAAGVIGPAHGHEDPEGDTGVAMVLANALGPQVLAAAARHFSIPLIHVSTDCVFSGVGPQAKWLSYPPDAKDLYGRSKLLGESIVQDDDKLVTAVRTSFVGFQHGLLAWLLDQARKGLGVEGYRRAWWSGSSARAVARGLLDMVADPPGGIQHLAMIEPISKDRLLNELKDAFGFTLAITPIEQPYVGRGLVATAGPLPPFEEAAAELAKEWKERSERS